MTRKKATERHVGDVELCTRVITELEYEPSVDATHIGVSVEDGVVCLTGYVGTYAEKLEAERAVRRVKGVIAIAEQIEVRYPSHKKTADDEIARRAVRTLEWYGVLPQEAVQITVQDGWLTLNGQVNWQYQKQAAEDAVGRLSGLIGITNHIVIAPAVEPAGVQKKIEEALRRRAGIEAQAIRVTVHDRHKVLLEGIVDSWDEREAAEKAAWSTVGVQAVDNRLAIVR